MRPLIRRCRGRCAITLPKVSASDKSDLLMGRLYEASDLREGGFINAALEHVERRIRLTDPIGRGDFGTVYSVAGGRLAQKVTGDHTDAAAWEIVRRAQRAPGVALTPSLPTIYAVWAFPRQLGRRLHLPHGLRVFGILMERIRPPDDGEASEAADLLDGVTHALDWRATDLQGKRGSLTLLHEAMTAAGDAGFGREAATLVRTWEDLVARGVLPLDLQSTDNVLIGEAGDWVIVDLGVSHVPRTRLPHFHEVPVERLVRRWAR